MRAGQDSCHQFDDEALVKCAMGLDKWASRNYIDRMNKYGRKGNSSRRSNAEAIIDAGNEAYYAGQSAREAVASGNEELAAREARRAAHAGIRCIILARPDRLADWQEAL